MAKCCYKKSGAMLLLAASLCGPACADSLTAKTSNVQQLVQAFKQLFVNDPQSIEPRWASVNARSSQSLSFDRNASTLIKRGAFSIEVAGTGLEFKQRF